MDDAETVATEVDAALGQRLRALRQGKGLSAKETARRAGLSPSYLSRLENGHLSPTVTTLTRVAQALGESLATIFGSADVGPVVRRSERAVIRNRGVDDQLLTPTRTGKLEVLETHIAPGAGSGAQAYTHQGDEECIIILEGSLRLWLDGVLYELEQGDAATFACGVPHRWENPGEATTRAMWVVTPAGY